MDGPKPLALLFGWGGSTPSQLRAYARLWTRLGFDTDLRIGSVLRGLLVPGGRDVEIREVARELVASKERATRPVVVHALSDNGFLSLAALLETLSQSAPGRRTLDALRAVVLDSAPGLWSARRKGDFATTFARGVMPALLKGLRQREALEHPVLTPVLRAGFGAYALAFPGNVKRMTASGERVLRDLPRVPVLTLYGDADELVPPRVVEAFALRLRERGFPVTERLFAGAGHVGLFVRDPVAYERALADHLRAAGLAVRAPRRRTAAPSQTPADAPRGTPT